MTTPDALESTYRRMEFVLGGAAVCFTAFMIGTTFAITRLPSDQAMQMIVVLTISVALAVVALLIVGFRSHRWTLGESALTIEQWYKVWPLTRKRRTSVSFADITAVHRIEMGFHVLIEVESRSGGSHRLAEPYVKTDRGIAIPDRRRLEAFAEALRERVARSGGATELSEGLTFWNRTPGLAVQAAMLVVAIAVSGGTVWGLLTIDNVPVRPHFAPALAILVLLPLGAAWMLRKSLRRRRLVVRR